MALGALAITMEVYDEHHEFQNALRARSPGRWDGVHEHIWMRREHCAPALGSPSVESNMTHRLVVRESQIRFVSSTRRSQLP